MVISEHASWIFVATPFVLFVTALSAGLIMPMVTAQAPLGLFGGVLTAEDAIRMDTQKLNIAEYSRESMIYNKKRLMDE